MKYLVHRHPTQFPHTTLYTMRTQPLKGRVAACSVMSNDSHPPLKYIEWDLRKKIARFLWDSRKAPK